MSSSPALQVIIVDSQPMFREGFALAVRSSRDLHVVAEAAGAKDALELAGCRRIDVAVIDLLMPSGSGISLATALLELQPRCRVLGLSAMDEPSLIADMLLAGATGFALKTQSTEEILDAIRLVASDLRYLPPGVSHGEVDRALASTVRRPLAALTRREREVFDLVTRGHSNTEIATRLAIARRTVETHRQNCANKLSAHSMIDMMRAHALHGGLAEGSSRGPRAAPPDSPDRELEGPSPARRRRGARGECRSLQPPGRREESSEASREPGVSGRPLTAR